MRAIKLVLAVCGFFLPIAFLCAQDPARAIIEKAIQAQGGEKQVAKLRTMRIKLEGKSPEEKNQPFVLEDTWQMPNKYRTVMRVQLTKEVAVTQIKVLDGDKAWAQFNDRTIGLKGNDLAEYREQVQGEHLDRLAFLNDKSRELSVLDEIKIQGKPAVGVLVKTKGHRDVKLYFDKSSGLLVKRERRIGGNILQQVFFSDYQEKDGLKHYRKISVVHEDKTVAEGTVTELEFFDKLDPKVFAKP